MTIKTISGIPSGFEAFLLKQKFQEQERSLVHGVSTDYALELLAQQLAIVAPHIPVYKFPAWDCLPYDRVSPSLDIISERVHTLSIALSGTQGIYLTTVSALTQRVPPTSLIQSSRMTLSKGMHLNVSDFTHFLTSKGFTRCDTVREAGEFAIRGSLIDVFASAESPPVRIDLFGEEIDHLRTFDPLSQKSQEAISVFSIGQISEVSLTPDPIKCFRTQYRALFGAKVTPLYEAISEGRKFSGMEHWLPLFYEEMATFLDYFPSPPLVTLSYQTLDAFQSRAQQIRDYYLARLEVIKGDTTPYHPIPPEKLYMTEDEWVTFLKKENVYHLTPFSQEGSEGYKGRRGPEFSAYRTQKEGGLLDAVIRTSQEAMEQGKRVVLACNTEGSLQRLSQMLQEHGSAPLTVLKSWEDTLEPHLYLTVLPLEDSFDVDQKIVISEQDIFGDRIGRIRKKRKKGDSFFKDFSDLNVGDLIVHREHGIGRYLGLETIKVNGIAHDCLQLIYDGGDKLFLPVENLDVISRYGQEDISAKLDSLGTAHWQARKAKIKKRIREVATYLIQLAADRELLKADVLQTDAGSYNEFCARFPFSETDDQLRAIDEILEDLSSGKPMDRLVCGDVGFGKTEVALRAAYAAASSGKQVAIVVPTTLLCRQHAETFSERFKGFPFRVVRLSRLETAREADLIRKELGEGKAQIVIATQAILSDKTTFSNLGLLIVDEEQHFGVKQKEKLKQLRTDVHSLTLTATPIPRTLQLALTGVREMSLITTPPIDRLAVRTFVMPYDGVIIREALMREHYRGGQSFYVCPRIEDLQKLEERLKDLVPSLKVAMAHGRMPTKQLEEVMTAYYDRRYDILLSTNIVESGIDIANANTLIIHRADRFGLAQLYQLRGRVGRGKVQAYAYLMLPTTAVSSMAQKRLEVMQTLDHLGAGFKLASHDLDIRGAGNIVGEEQSGHIKEVGVELYQQLLEEAILTLKAEAGVASTEEMSELTPQINLGTAVLIPETYIQDLDLRLSLYRRAVDFKTHDELEAFAAELIDRFGPLPEEVINFLQLLEIKNLCRQAYIEKVDAGPKGMVISFHKNTFPNPAGLIAYVQSQAGRAKIRPDQKIVFIRGWDELKVRSKGVLKICKELIGLL